MLEVVACESANYFMEINGLTMKTCLSNFLEPITEARLHGQAIDLQHIVGALADNHFHLVTLPAGSPMIL